ncbi:MAG: PAS domain S-box protein [bacterium]|nr:PAS domain S-box protein [bacterium]
MDLIYFYFQNNLDAVFLIYGLAFLVMGIVILVQPREKSEFEIANILWLLALFGITHGANELMDMWAIIKGRNHTSDIIRWFMLAISFVFLFEFGRRLFQLAASNTNLFYKKISTLLGWWVTPLVICFILIAGFVSPDFWATGTIWTRYLLGFPGGILIGSGLFLYYEHKKEILDPLGVKKYFRIISVSFFIYGILGGFIVPKGIFFPSNYINTDSFINLAHIPVQVFRAICAITVAWGVSGMLKIFNWEIRTKLEEAQTLLKQQLKEIEKSYMEVVKNSSDMIYFIDTDNHIIHSNKQGHELPGYLKTELIGKSFKELCTSELWKDIEDCLEKLKREGTFLIDKGNIIKKDSDKLDISIHLVAVYDILKNYTGARVIIRDITKKVKLKEEHMKKVKELEDFYEMAIGRELKMLELKEEVNKLNRELKNIKNEKQI